MSIVISSWDSIHTSCGTKPCFFFKPTLAFSNDLLDNDNQTKPVTIDGSDLYDGLHYVKFDKVKSDDLSYIGI